MLQKLQQRCKPLYLYIIFWVVSEVVTRLLISREEYMLLFKMPFKLNLFQSFLALMITFGSIFVFCYFKYCKIAKYVSYFYMLLFFVDFFFILQYKYNQYKLEKERRKQRKEKELKTNTDVKPFI